MDEINHISDVKLLKIEDSKNLMLTVLSSQGNLFVFKVHSELKIDLLGLVKDTNVKISKEEKMDFKLFLSNHSHHKMLIDTSNLMATKYNPD